MSSTSMGMSSSLDSKVLYNYLVDSGLDDISLASTNVSISTTYT